jgi:hypothetical protein
MNHSMIYAGAFGVIVLCLAVTVILRRRPRKLNMTHSTERWHSLQKNCADKKNWPQAILEADRLLDDTLKRRRFHGKTAGERLVAAQHKLSDNESVWFGHKLRNRIHDNDLKKISKTDTLEALNGFRQALKDLGALHDKPSSLSVDKTEETPS